MAQSGWCAVTGVKEDGPTMRRWISNLATAAALLLCMVMSLLWARSYWFADRLDGRISAKYALIISSKQGELVITVFQWHGASNWMWRVQSLPVDDVMSFPVGDVRQYVKFLGFGSIDRPIYFVMNPEQQTPQGKIMIFGAATATLNGSAVLIPWWLPVSLSGIVSARMLFRIMRMKQRMWEGRCPECGYDLRATPERCPECGRTTQATAPVKTGLEQR